MPQPVHGDHFPDFELPDHSGQRWSLAEALGRTTLVLVFYRGDW